MRKLLSNLQSLAPIGHTKPRRNGFRRGSIGSEVSASGWVPEEDMASLFAFDRG